MRFNRATNRQLRGVKFCGKVKGRERRGQGEESKGREKRKPARVCGCVKIKRKERQTTENDKAAEKL